MTLREAHVTWAWVMIGSNAVAGLWCLGAHRWARLRVRPMWWFTVFAELAVFVQVILGVATMQSEDVETEQFHMFYGFVAIITIAILYSYRAQLRHRLLLLYGLGGLFIMGLGLRAVVVGAL